MRKVLIKNFLSLSSVQFANKLLPLVTIPYIVRVIGIENFGLLAFVQSIIFFFLTFVGYGYTLYGPKEISIHRDNTAKISHVFSSIFVSQMFLFVVSTIVFIGMLLSVGSFRAQSTLFIFSYLAVISDVLLPLWFFQGMQKMTYIAVLNFVSKILYAISIFLLVKTADDFILIPLLTAAFQFFIGLIALYIIFSSFKIKLVKVGFTEIKEILQKSYWIFVSEIAVSIYMRAPMLLLGIFAGNVYVGYLKAAETLYTALRGILRNFTNTFYPHTSKLIHEKDRSVGLGYLRKLLFLYVGVTTALTLVIILFAKPIILTLYGDQFVESINVLRIYSFLLIIVGINDVQGIQTMLPFGLVKEYGKATTVSSIVTVIFGLILIPPFQHMGAAMCILLSRVVITLMMYQSLKKNGLNLFEKWPSLTELVDLYKSVFTSLNPLTRKRKR